MREGASMAGPLLIAVVLMTACNNGYMESSAKQVIPMEELPSIFEIAYGVDIELTVTDLHSFQQTPEGNTLSIGMILYNPLWTEVEVRPEDFTLIDSRGDPHSPLPWMKGGLYNPLCATTLAPGEAKAGALAFPMSREAGPTILLHRGVESVRLDQEVTPPGTLASPEDRVSVGTFAVEIAAIFEAEGGDKVLVEYGLQSLMDDPIPLSECGYGRFADLIDRRGISYSPQEFKMLGPAIPPCGNVSGYQIYSLPPEAEPGFLIFWPPNQEGIVFDLRGCFGDGDGPTAISSMGEEVSI